MISIRPISIRTIHEAAHELERIGLSSDEAERLAAGTLCLHLKASETIVAVPKTLGVAIILIEDTVAGPRIEM